MQVRTVLLLGLLHLVSASPRHKKTTSVDPTPTTNAPAATSNCAPGAHISILSNFDLQLPYATKGTSPAQISGSALAGCNGYQNASWFYWDDSNNYMVMKAPPLQNGDSCAHTSGSVHCRTELREENPDSWSPKGTNTMTVTLSVPKPDDGSHGTVVGQVFSAEFSKPVAELYYNQSGDLVIGVEQTTSGGHSIFSPIGNVAVGTKFTYILSYSDNNLTVTLNGGTAQSFPTSQLGDPDSYFKVGDYNQGVDDSSEVDVYSVAIVHN
jgi:hypothetical protein